jgi:hypothetical protein
VPVPVDRKLVGMVDGPVAPSDDPARLGSVTLDTAGPFTVGEHVTMRLVHTVGHHGMDDRGAMKIVMRFPADGGAWQTEDPEAPNFVSVLASQPCRFRSKYEAFGNARPWFKVLTVQVVGGCLAEGDTVTITLGDRSGGSPGLRLQTFVEDAWELKFLVDPCATGWFSEIPAGLAVEIRSGPPARWIAVIPTRWTVGVPFRLGIKAEDALGNPSDRADAALQLEGSLPVEGLPTETELRPGSFARAIEGLSCAAPGLLTITVRDAAGEVVATTNPMTILPAGRRSFWGDLHGQSAETIGINTAEAWFTFARDKAFLDVCAHQANDFQITGAFWAQLQEVSARFHAPGRFVTFPGYEWSGNTAVGGDRNVYFRDEGRPIRRSSHALLTDRRDTATDATTAHALFQALSGENAIAYAHVGGRWADLAYAHDGRIERAVEIHSDWGTFEWLLDDALRLGHRVGVVANSDGHKGRPGASWPGASTFGAYGGLTCFFADSLDRDSIFQAIRDRRTVATTGCRLDLDVRVSLDSGRRFRDDPVLGTTATVACTEAGIGDIVLSASAEIPVRVRVAAGAPIARVDVRVGTEVVTSWIPPGTGRRIAVRWEGAQYRGRGREVTWDGHAAVVSATIRSVVRINAFNPDHPLEGDRTTLRWKAITTGNFGGFDLVCDEEPGARLAIHTEPASLEVPLEELDTTGVRVDAGGLGKALSVRRLPDDAPRTLDWTCTVAMRPDGDTAIGVRVLLEDGHVAWSSPIYVVP